MLCRPSLVGSSLRAALTLLAPLTFLIGCGDQAAQQSPPPATPKAAPTAQPSGAPSASPGTPSTQPSATQPATGRPTTTANGDLAVKIQCLQRGIHVLTGEKLTSLGVRLDTIDPNTMALLHFDKSVPYYFTGSGNKFELGDAIYFFSDGATQDGHYYINVEADYAPQTQNFMLRLGPSDYKPVRYTDVLPTGPAEDAQETYPAVLTGGSIHFEENRTWQFFDAPLWKKAPTDFRSWASLTYPPTTRSTPIMEQTFRLPEGDYTQPARLRVLLIGASDQWGMPLSTPHRMDVQINGKFKHEHRWRGWEPQVGEIDLPADVLQAGENTLRLEVLEPDQDPSGTQRKVMIEVVNVDWFQVDFRQPTRVTDDTNEFFFDVARDDDGTTQRTQRFSIRNFTSPQVMILDRATTSRLHAEAFAQADDPTHYAVNVERVNQPGTVVASTLTAAQAPYQADLVEVTHHFKQPPTSEMLVLTHPNFIAPMQRFLDWKRSRGLSVEMIDVKQLFNEHRAGYATPLTLREFIRTAKQQNPQLRYVLLVGDSATIAAYQSYVPAYAYLQSGTHANDNYFASFTDPEGLPELAIGRISARTVEHVENYLNKLIAYESHQNPGDWMGRGLFIGASYEWAQQDCMDLIKSQIRPSLLGAYVYTELFNEDPTYHKQLSEQLISELNRGSLVVNFFGHGGGSIWEMGPGAQTNQFTLHLFDQEKVTQLKNVNAPPLVMALTCYTNDFDDPHVAQTLGEAFVNSPAGAIGVIGAAARSSISVNKRYTTIFWNLLNKGEHRRLGDLFTEAKREMKSPAANAQFILLGDPSLEFVLPTRDITVTLPEPEVAAAGGVFHYTLPATLDLPTSITCTVLDTKEAQLGRFSVIATAASGELKLADHLGEETVGKFPPYYRVVLTGFTPEGRMHIGGAENTIKPRSTPAADTASTPEAKPQPKDAPDLP